MLRALDLLFACGERRGPPRHAIAGWTRLLRASAEDARAHVCKGSAYDMYKGRGPGRALSGAGSRPRPPLIDRAACACVLGLDWIRNVTIGRPSSRLICERASKGEGEGCFMWKDGHKGRVSILVKEEGTEASC
jgi:hypothetical protein